VQVLVAAAASLQSEALCLALGATGGMAVAGVEPADSASSAGGRESDAIIFLSQPQLDAGPGWTSVAAIARDLAELGVSTPIVAVAPSDAPEAMRLTLEAGAGGFVSQSQPLADVRTAVATVIAGDTYLRADHAINVARLDGSDANRLTDREIDVLRLLAVGLTNREAAARLHLSERTVESHRASLRSKRGLANQAALVTEAVALGLIG